MVERHRRRRRRAADSQEIPLHDRDGAHWITLEIEFSEDGNHLK
jgi:hypothetical protein